MNKIRENGGFVIIIILYQIIISRLQVMCHPLCSNPDSDK